MNEIHEQITEAEADAIRQYREDIIDACPVCQGSGAIYTPKGASRCDCVSRFRWARRLVLSGLPKRLHAVARGKFGIQHTFESVTSEGATVMGNGKTTFLALCVKHELLVGGAAYYVDAEQLARTEDDSHLWSRWKDADFIAVDDVHLLEPGPEQYWIRKLTKAIRKLENEMVVLAVGFENPKGPMAKVDTDSLMNTIARMCELHCEVRQDGLEAASDEDKNTEAAKYNALNEE